MIYSYSSISTYQLCPKKFSFQYKERLKVPQKTSIEMFMGKIIHESLEELYHQKESGSIWDSEKLVNDFEERWTHQFDSNTILVTKNNESYFKDWGIHCLRQYHEKNHPFSEETIGIEQSITFNVGKDGAQMRGVIDRIIQKNENYIQILDYKTYHQLPAPNWFDENEQLALYQIWAQKAFPKARQIELVWDFVGLNEVVQKELTVEQLDHVQTKTVQAIQTIERTKTFLPHTGDHCVTCSFQPHCPAFQSNKSKTLFDFA